MARIMLGAASASVTLDVQQLIAASKAAEAKLDQQLANINTALAGLDDETGDHPYPCPRCQTIFTSRERTCDDHAAMRDL